MTAVILAGGRSSRMGTPKALLPFDNEPLILHLVRKLQPRFSRIVVVAAPGQELPAMPATIVRDDVAHQGPVGGICYGLRAVEDAFAFVTSCDSAFLNTTLVMHLVSRIEEADVVVPRWDGRLQPLVAGYRTSVVPVLERQLADGELRPITLFERVRTRYVEEAEIRRFDPTGDSFFNMNRPEDYEEALRRWRAGTTSHGPVDAGVPCTVELLGVARLLGGQRELSFTLAPGETLRELFAALVDRVPALAGSVITSGGWLAEGYACSVNGLSFVRSPDTPVVPGDAIVLLSADAGG